MTQDKSFMEAIVSGLPSWFDQFMDFIFGFAMTYSLTMVSIENIPVSLGLGVLVGLLFTISMYLVRGDKN